MRRTITLLGLNLVLGPSLGLCVFVATLLLEAIVAGGSHLQPLLAGAGGLFSATGFVFAFLFGAIPATLATIAVRLADRVIERPGARLASGAAIGGCCALLLQIIFHSVDTVLPLLLAGGSVGVTTTAINEWLFGPGTARA